MDAVQAVAVICRAFRLDADPSTIAVHAGPLLGIDRGELAAAVDRVLRQETAVVNPTAVLFAAVAAGRKEAALNLDPLASLPDKAETNRLSAGEVADMVERLRRRASGGSGRPRIGSGRPERPTTPTRGSD
jgi:hypothetical protein